MLLDRQQILLVVPARSLVGSSCRTGAFVCTHPSASRRIGLNTFFSIVCSSLAQHVLVRRDVRDLDMCCEPSLPSPRLSLEKQKPYASLQVSSPLHVLGAVRKVVTCHSPTNVAHSTRLQHGKRSFLRLLFGLLWCQQLHQSNLATNFLKQRHRCRAL